VTVAISLQRRQCSRFSRCVGVAETNPRNCFSRCADDESPIQCGMETSAARIACARIILALRNFRRRKNFNGKRADAAATSNSFAGA
jgi:hypothetical protein